MTLLPPPSQPSLWQSSDVSQNSHHQLTDFKSNIKDNEEVELMSSDSSSSSSSDEWWKKHYGTVL